jgi:imidazolonepropionase-like amidohydrolase
MAPGVIAPAIVVMAGMRIVAAGGAGTVRLPMNARVIDARGLSMYPGLWDMHAHVKQPEWALRILPRASPRP